MSDQARNISHGEGSQVAPEFLGDVSERNVLVAFAVKAVERAIMPLPPQE